MNNFFEREHFRIKSKQKCVGNPFRTRLVCVSFSRAGGGMDGGGGSVWTKPKIKKKWRKKIRKIVGEKSKAPASGQGNDWEKISMGKESILFFF